MVFTLLSAEFPSCGVLQNEAIHSNVYSHTETHIESSTG